MESKILCFILLGIVGYANGQNVPTNVTQIVLGSMMMIQNGFDYVGSVSLVRDQGVNIIVDTPASLDNRNRDLMLRGIQQAGLTPASINYLVTTHGHPDHFGQDHLFPNARRVMTVFNGTGSSYLYTSLFNDKDIKTMSTNTEVWSTPGHTGQDISLIVKNTVCCGTVAIVGDLIWNAQDVLNSTVSMNAAMNRALARLSRNRVLCASDWIVPGHGPMFRVTDQMKQIALCQGRLSSSG
ncbi:unnamed protein product, partial [Mesorhabditis belari]|uniref:Metallo-beta-lactamase domain-containing protein n=1 Tax=Mesorhabditis belari TaxID=2138241 RepID=A0AAF3ECA9_9BILA